MSQRRACQLIGIASSTFPDPRKICGFRERLTKQVIELACQFGRYGYRRITTLLNREGWRVNHKRVECIWKPEGLKVSEKQPKCKRL